jgi:hypothetical protein
MDVERWHPVVIHPKEAPESNANGSLSQARKPASLPDVTNEGGRQTGVVTILVNTACVRATGSYFIVLNRMGNQAVLK